MLQAQKASDKCSDVLLLDGSESLLKWGMDSTRNWWAITSPYESMYRLTVNGKASEVYHKIAVPEFSPDGIRYSCWAIQNNRAIIVSESEPKVVPCTAQGELLYSGNSSVLAYSYFDGSVETVLFGPRRVTLAGRASKLFLNFEGDRLAAVVQLGTNKALIVNGKQGPLYDDIKPFGFWNDGQFIYAARSGAQWRVYRGEEEIAGVFSDVREGVVNLTGTVAAVIIAQISVNQVVLFAEDYTRPVYSPVHQRIEGLILHPREPMYAAHATTNGNHSVVMTGIDYSSGSASVSPLCFTHDGKELTYFGCDNDCFMSINGRKIYINTSLASGICYPHKPASDYYALTTTTSLVLSKIEKNEIWVSKMCDEVSASRFNWRTDNYQALGRINQRLYLLSCMIK